LIAAIATAGILGGTAVAETPVVAERRENPPGLTCEVDEPDGTIQLSAVMRVILFCQDALALSAAQRDRLDTLNDAFVQDVVRREARRDLLEGALAALLRPDPDDPGRPVDIEAAEAKIRELERIAADQDIAALRAVEGSKALLTASQRATLATLLAAPRGAAAPKFDL
jgi:hypothetical protein